ncbi:SPFH domain, Band 7 family protein [Caldanaerobius fijiensis DSM 17918]|uniref:SPFH domain, Band 7 family protein n=1 Tax=Caldanaerobius fijiensis DSM 17918 TaxID=1121256 RepID=A0A1M5D6E1_9THEO|nr:slipin family protein [Caldanaerobius fijiensis]SHF62534.1 SPFH domain, Band 7 family protein [Caldanaerobius fijiensis DSM 17918]
MNSYPVVTIFAIIFLIEAVWWIVWMAIALSRKIYANFYFMLVSFLIWGVIDIVVLRGWSSIESLLYIAPSIVLTIIPLILLPGMVSIIAEYQRGVLFRFGRLSGLLQPGLNVIFPFGIDRVWKVDLRTLTIDVAKQEIITKDNVPIMVDAVVYFNVSDPILATTKVVNYTQSTTLLAQTILRSILGQHELDEMLTKRAELNEKLRELLDKDTDPWGIKVTAVEIKSIELPDTMKRAMAKQAEAERERRAKIISADGEYQAAQKLLEAAQLISKEPAALQLRYLQTLPEIAAEKNSTILFPLPIELLKAFSNINNK